MSVWKRICVSLLLIFFAQSPVGAQTHARLKALYTDKQYFKLRDALRDFDQDRSAEMLFYRGAVANKFNRLPESIKYLNEYLKRAKSDTDPDLPVEGYGMLADGYRKLYQYRKAARAYATLLSKFGGRLDAEKKSDLENSVRLWGALGSVPPQTASLHGDSQIAQDKDGHIPLEINGRAVALAFDTGANVSVVTDSLARKLALRIIDASVEVGAVAGNEVKARLAVARKLKLGNAAISNAVFLVFDDKDLYIAEAHFQINGLVGFPVIAALGEVTFVRGSGISFPAAPTAGGAQNMCLDELSPLVAGQFKGQELIFALDTGASRTTLYPRFYADYRQEIEASYEKHTERVRGVGGFREIKGYLGTGVVLSFAGSDAHLTRVPILTEYTSETSRHFYGNLGQDLIKQFGRMTLNFKTMSVVFK